MQNTTINGIFTPYTIVIGTLLGRVQIFTLVLFRIADILFFKYYLQVPEPFIEIVT